MDALALPIMPRRLLRPAAAKRDAPVGDAAAAEAVAVTVDDAP